jgi:hypothetical protein
MTRLSLAAGARQDAVSARAHAARGATADPARSRAADGDISTDATDRRATAS